MPSQIAHQAQADDGEHYGQHHKCWRIRHRVAPMPTVPAIGNGGLILIKISWNRFDRSERIARGV
jgi:hypothetical protein